RVRLDRQLDDGRQRRGVVDVHVGRQSFAQAPDETVVLEIVHAAVAGAGRLRLQVEPERMVVLAAPLLPVVPLVLPAAPLDVYAGRIPLKQALRRGSSTRHVATGLHWHART